MTVVKGLAAIKAAAERKGGEGGDFKPFCPEIRWRDQEDRYILILTNLEDLQEYAVHEWIPVGTMTTRNGEVKPKYEWFISRKDPSIGESLDDLEDRLGNQPRLRFMGVAVELEPVTEQSPRGGKKVVGFTVACDTYTRKGEDDEEIEVTYPKIGVISLSSANFWGYLGSFQERHGSVNEVPFSVTRRGADANTTYDFTHMMGTDFDLSALIDNIEGVSYLSTADDFDEILAEAKALDDELDAAMLLADALLSKRIAELSDPERYRTLVSPIEDLPQRFGKKKGAKGTPTKSKVSQVSRARASEPVVETHTESTGAVGFDRLRERARQSAAK